MIGLDTNVVVRYIMQDDPSQSAKASRLIESMTTETPGFITQISVVELVWVLTGAYGLNRDQVFQVIQTLLSTKELLIERAEIVWKALKLFESGKADFADCLIERSGAAGGCVHTKTFDRAAVRGCSMVLIK